MHRTVLVRCYYHAAFLPGRHPNRYVVFSLSVIDGQRVGWRLCVQVCGQRRHHPQWQGRGGIEADPPCVAALETR